MAVHRVLEQTFLQPPKYQRIVGIQKIINGL